MYESYYNALEKTITNQPVERTKLLKSNLAQFAAVKTDNLLQELDRARVDKNGVLLSKDAYLKQANQIVRAYNRYQAAENNTAIHRNRVVKQWAQFEKERDLFQNIQWIRTRSANPRDLHLKYAGRIWSMDDPFWRTNFPGCVWNCKCSWKTTAQPVTDNSNVEIVKASPGLETNPYYSNQVFSEKHPYYKTASSHTAAKGSLLAPDDVVYLKKKTLSGKTYLEHYNAQYELETASNRTLVDVLLRNNYDDVKLLPQVHRSETALRTRYYTKDIPAGKCPDCIADGKLVEFKVTKDRNKARAIADAASKADVAVISIEETLRLQTIEAFIQKSFVRHPALQQIIIINNGETFLFTP